MLWTTVMREVAALALEIGSAVLLPLVRAIREGDAGAAQQAARIAASAALARKLVRQAARG